MKMKLSWDEHIAKLKLMLQVDSRIVYMDDPEYKELCKPYGGFSLTTNGAYLWKLGEDTVILRTVGKVNTLAHELRHAWQYKNRVEQNFEYHFDHTEPLITNKGVIAYASSDTEADANKFSIKYCKEHGLVAQKMFTSYNHSCNILVSKLFGK